MRILKMLLNQRQRIAELEAENAKLISDIAILRDGYNGLSRDLKSRTFRVFRLLEKLEKVKAERDAAMADIQRRCDTCALCSRNNGTGEMCPHSFDCNQVDGDHWEWRGAKDTNVPNKTATDINVGDKEEE